MPRVNNIKDDEMTIKLIFRLPCNIHSEHFVTKSAFKSLTCDYV